MGMFDSVYLKVKCPNCGSDGEKELQTKDLDCLLSSYRIGDFIGTLQFRWLHCIAGCTSPVCHEWQIKRDGYRSGLGYMWYCFAEVDDSGKITGRVVREISLDNPKKSAQDNVA